MQETNLKSHSDLNGLYKDVFKKSLEVEKQYEEYNKRLSTIERDNMRLDTRTKDQEKML